ncbi:spermatogenesis-associated protein 20-like [Montipora capricornis]|uniref:spermatogenesis-associated protein 20-like n=1 Tax=Montipora capricornis TaxID=246305 RepID=UPI0035F1A5F3
MICRESTIEGFVDDYTFMIRGLLDLYEASFNDNWIAWAEMLQQKQDELFWDKDDGGYYNSPEGDPNIVLRLKEVSGYYPDTNIIMVSIVLQCKHLKQPNHPK